MRSKTRLLAVLLLVSTTASAAGRQVQGVPWDVVDWETLCKNVKPLAYHNSNGQVCPKVHPAARIWRKWHDVTGREKPEPKWKCETYKKEYERATKKTGACKHMFGIALKVRAMYPEDFDEPLKVWRSRYFGPWLTGD